MTMKHHRASGFAAAALSAGALLGPLSAVQADGAGPEQAVSAQAVNREVLRTGESLRAGDALVSPSGRFRLQLDAAGTLALVERANRFTAGQETSVFSVPGVSVVLLQDDGNLVAYGPGNAVRLDLGLAGSGSTAVRVQDDRNVVAFGADGRVTGDASLYNQRFLDLGAVLLAGDMVVGEEGVSTLVMQADGNLVLYRGAVPLWDSGTNGNPGSGLVVQADGNAVVYSSPETGTRPLWSSGTVGATTGDTIQYLEVEDTELSVAREDAVNGPLALWGSNWDKAVLEPGDELDPGDRRTSADGRCLLILQADSNLVQFCAGVASFQTGATPRFTSLRTETAVMQLDGNLVVYRVGRDGSSLLPLYDAGTRVAGSRLVVQGDGNSVLVAPDGRPVWSHRTGVVR